MKIGPKVSIVTPAYNQADFLRETIESVLAQDYTNVEYVVLDDGSTDNTPSILADYSDLIVCESHTNIGQTATINKGWRMTNGEIVAWLNSDDTLLPGAITTAVNYLNQHPEVGIVFGDCVVTDAVGTPLGMSPPQPPYSYSRFVTSANNTISQPSAFIRREVVDKVGYLSPEYFYFMDWEFWMRSGLYFKIAHIDDVLSTYRLHHESKTVAHQVKAAPELERIYAQYFSRDDIPAEIRERKGETLMNMYFLSGGYYLQGGDQRGATRMAAKAIRAYPRGMTAFRNMRQFLYCLAGNSIVYRTLRRWFSSPAKPFENRLSTS